AHATTERSSGSPPPSTPPKRPIRTSDRKQGVYSMSTISLFFLVSVAMGGVIWVFVYPYMSGEKKAEQRMATVSRPQPVTRAASAARVAQKNRREQVEGSLKDLEARRAKTKRLPLHIKIQQAGLTWSKRKFIIISVALGIGAFLFFNFIDAGLLA